MFRIALSLLFAAMLGLGAIGCERKDRDANKPSGTTGTETDRDLHNRSDTERQRERDMSTTPRSNTGSDANR